MFKICICPKPTDETLASAAVEAERDFSAFCAPEASHTEQADKADGRISISMRKKIRLRLRGMAAFCVICMLLSAPALAADALVPMGDAVGIQMTVGGVLVAGLSEVETESGVVSPAGQAGVHAGDVIVAADGGEIDSAAALMEAVAAAKGSPLELSLLRNGKSLCVTVTPAKDTDGGFRLGLWLRDGVSGIGTVTYVDPDTGAFGALGHGVNDAKSGTLLPVEEGSVYRAQIVDITRGEAGSPGELSGSFYAGDVLGRIEGNTESGIFGTIKPELCEKSKALPVAKPSEVVSGPATILTCVSGQVREYEVEIARTGLAGGAGRDLMVHVTDPELLKLTGGIVQGMSGSPIIQNGKLVGAVTHVLVSDATRGYGIFVEHMLDAAKNAA